MPLKNQLAYFLFAERKPITNLIPRHSIQFFIKQMFRSMGNNLLPDIRAHPINQGD